MTTTVPVLRQEDNVDEVTWRDRRGNLSFKSLIDGDETATSKLTFGTATFEAGGYLAPHRHAQSEIYYILAGTGVVTIDGVSHDVRAGTGIFIPGNAEHTIANTGAAKDALRLRRRPLFRGRLSIQLRPRAQP